MLRVGIEFLGDTIELPFGETLVGRDVGCTLRFNDPAVSRRHLRFVRRQHGEVFVEDLGSSNGTLLNSRALRSAIRVHDGDVVEVGSRTLTVRISDLELSTDDAPSTLVLDISPAERSNLRHAARTAVIPTVPPPFATAHEAHKLDRRTHDRRSAELSIIYTSSELEIEATTRDLSRSGVFVCSSVLDPIETRCQLTLLVDGGPPLSIAGIVRRVVDHTSGQAVTGLGVEFTNVGSKERAWLEIFLTSDDGAA